MKYDTYSDKMQVLEQKAFKTTRSLYLDDVLREPVIVKASFGAEVYLDSTVKVVVRQRGSASEMEVDHMHFDTIFMLVDGERIELDFKSFKRTTMYPQFLLAVEAAAIARAKDAKIDLWNYEDEG